MWRNRASKPPSQFELHKQEVHRSAERSVEIAALLQAECEEFVFPHAITYFEKSCELVPHDDDYLQSIWTLHTDSMVEPWVQVVGKPLYSLPLEESHDEVNSNYGLTRVLGAPCDWWLRLVEAHAAMVDMTTEEFGQQMCVGFMVPYDEAVRRHNAWARGTPTNFHAFAAQRSSIDPRQRKSMDDARQEAETELAVTTKFLSAYARRFSPTLAKEMGLQSPGPGRSS
jgi:hypothetical protein